MPPQKNSSCRQGNRPTAALLPWWPSESTNTITDPPSGAPKTGDAGDWAPRIAQGKDVLADHAINGFNAMPAKGSCMDCSDDEIIAAIEHMIEGL